ncbi:MAG: patatin-like phospholipase family protein [Ruminococcaceae bacterium]|nr:patatin-like phospholipase family protein [Oscillospiraceae bacterium]
MKEYGLVLAGGGAKGVYQLGAWKAMRELGVNFSAVAGVSIGSINGALIAADCYEEAEQLWQCASVDRGVRIAKDLKDPENLFSLRNATVLFKEIVRNGGIDASPTKELLLQFIDEKKVRESNVKFGMVTFSLSEFAPLEIFLDKIPDGELVDYLLASSKVPGVSKIGPEGERYLDGGVYDNAPIGLLRKNGFNRIIVVDISSMKGIGHKSDMTNAEFIYIRPFEIDDLGAAFDFSDEMYEKRLKMGYLDTRKAFGYLSGRQFYFECATFREMLDEFGADALEQLETLGYELGMERFKVYGKDKFLYSLKEKYTEYQKEQQLKEEESEQKFYAPILKKLPKFNSDNEYAEAVAVLDNIII